MTAGVAALGAETVTRIVKTIAVYDDRPLPCQRPTRRARLWVFEVDGHKIFFKSVIKSTNPPGALWLSRRCESPREQSYCSGARQRENLSANRNGIEVGGTHRPAKPRPKTAPVPHYSRTEE